MSRPRGGAAVPLGTLVVSFVLVLGLLILLVVNLFEIVLAQDHEPHVTIIAILSTLTAATGYLLKFVIALVRCAQRERRLSSSA